MPVRLKDLQRNKKRELNKLLVLLQSYAIVNDNVRLTCTHYPQAGSKTLCITTAGAKTMRENIASVFGTKQAGQLLPLQGSTPDGSVSFDGFVSKIEQGCWRSSPDRQFTYLNSRPVDLPKLTREINAVYRSFFSNTSSHMPVLFLNVKVPTDAFDVNVTPDKRKVFLHNEDELCELIKQTLETMYQPSRFTYSSESSPSLLSNSSPSSRPSQLSEVFPRDDAMIVLDPTNEVEDEANQDERSPQPRAHSPLTVNDVPTAQEEPIEAPTTPSRFVSPSPTTPSSRAAVTLEEAPNPRATVLSQSQASSQSQSPSTPTVFRPRFVTTTPSPVPSSSPSPNSDATDPTTKARLRTSMQRGTKRNLTDFLRKKQASSQSSGPSRVVVGAPRSPASCSSDEEPESFPPTKRAKVANVQRKMAEGSQVEERVPPGVGTAQVPKASKAATKIQVEPLVLNTDVSAIRRVAGAAAVAARTETRSETSRTKGESLRTTIESDAAEVEGEFRRIITKSHFSTMKVCGQFNLGFIIARSDDDLFIVDQLPCPVAARL
eukprot:c13763_g1_i2.p1 GENE.c13763_g1_i2~~c13763_g1_i2.p1  ORF type:complete len:547 (+),score=92.21 c13763_g1_i2:390-2030(+)